MAPTTKPPGQRQRRNTDQAAWTKLGAHTDEPPPWPYPRKPTAPAKAYWDAIWKSPMSRMFLDSDHFPIARACRLHAKEATGKASSTELGELRQLEQLYGLSPKARRSLQWEIEQAAGPGQAHARQPVDDVRDQVVSARRDRLQRLK